MKSIDVAELPEPVAEAIAAVVKTLQQQFSKTTVSTKPTSETELLVRPGKVLKPVTREEIYEDAR